MKRRESQQATGRGSCRAFIIIRHLLTLLPQRVLKASLNHSFNTVFTAAHPINKHTHPSRKTLVILPILQTGKISPGEVVSFTRLPI